MSVLRGWQRGHVVAPESLRRFPEHRLGGNRRDETENKPAPRRLGSGRWAGRAGSHGCSGLGRLRRARRRRGASPRAARAAVTGTGWGTCCASAAEPKCRSLRHPVGSIPHPGLPPKRCAQPDASSRTFAACWHTWTLRWKQPWPLRASLTCPISASLLLRGFGLLWQSAVLIINSCCKQIQSLFSPSLPVTRLCQLSLPELQLR